MFNRILYAAKPREWAEYATSYVRDLALTCGAEVIVLRVAEVPEEEYGLARKLETDPESATGRLETAQKVEEFQTAETIAAALVEDGIAARSETRQGRIADEILAAANDLGADVIALGGSRRSALTAFLTGSIPAEIVRKSTRPVMFLPDPEA